MNINIETFNNWAKENKDKSMERGHASSVDQMFKILKDETPALESSFSFIDIGCGNGWVIRKILENKNCYYALGIDGAKHMINKATRYKTGDFIQSDIESFNFEKKFDIVFSMETLYYLKNIDNFIDKLYNTAINKKGSLIIGVDHYKENTSTLNWDKEYNLKTNTLSIKEWYEKLSKYPFSSIKKYQYGRKENWEGTLILYAQK
ncbi:MAG: nodulation protein S NodS [Candidatus Marinimicrobia bacterium]|nr:nodulation protein S NodS [Candidatus Neomarinimicrobiota bacterium]|tara:strand:+ start:9460 stop:10074 length:615 start_codon:yes stop_codon:yes gene_type:complete